MGEGFGLKWLYLYLSKSVRVFLICGLRTQGQPVYAKSNLHMLAHPHVRIALGKNPCSPILSRAFHSKAFLRVPAA